MADADQRVSERLAQLAREIQKERAAGGGPAGHARSSHGPDGRGVAGPEGTPAAALRQPGRRFAAGAIRWVLTALVAGVLPFVVLLRGATWLYASGRLGTWPALAAAAVLTFLVLAAYVLLAARYFRGRFGIGRAAVQKRMLQGTAVLVVAYLAYGLVFLSGANAKSDTVRAEYRALHPMLRMAVGTLVLLDSDLLVTDAGRTLDDYAAMGLTPNEASLHLRQPDGFAHALDLRTAGRPEALNVLTRLYFAAAGFRTLRHVGTADHLHVSLPPP